MAATRQLHACLLRGDKVLLCGDGGSAAAAQHLSTELMICELLEDALT